MTTARLFARDAEAFKSAFIAHGQARTFLADLGDLIEQFDQALRDLDAGKDENAAARASIEAALTAGTAAVQKLNAIVINRLRDDPEVMVKWNRDRRVRYPRSRHSVAVAPSVAAPAESASSGSASTAVTTPVAASANGHAAAAATTAAEAMAPASPVAQASEAPVAATAAATPQASGPDGKAA